MAEKTEAGEELGMRRRRLRYRAWHRGTREMDFVLGPYADAHVDTMDADELQRLEDLMAESDPELLAWVMGQVPVPPHVDNVMVDRLIAFRAAIPPAR